MRDSEAHLQVKLMLPIAYFIDPTDLLTLARLAEKVGLDGISCGELNGVEEFSMLAAIAVGTDNIHLETAVTAVPTRSPEQIVASARCLSELAPGRFTLGLGAGTPAVAAFHGRAFDAPLQRTAEALHIIRDTLREDGVPVKLAAINRGMLTLAATSADGVILSLLTPPSMVEASAQVIRQAYSAAQRSDHFDITAIQYGFAGLDIELADRAFRRELAAKYDVPTYREAALSTSSTKEADAVQAAWRAKERDLATTLVPQRAVDALLTTGGADAFCAMFQTIQAAGADGVIVVPVTPQRAAPSDAAAVINALGEAKHQLYP